MKTRTCRHADSLFDCCKSECSINGSGYSLDCGEAQNRVLTRIWMTIIRTGYCGATHTFTRPTRLMRA